MAGVAARRRGRRRWWSGANTIPSFTVAGASAYRDDVPDAEVHILEAGHFALDEATDEIATLVRDFLARLDGHKG